MLISSSGKNTDVRLGDSVAKLLIIEDDVTMLDLLRVHLKAVGHSVRVASDAADGIRYILADKPDLILSDVGMPYLDGMELLHALRGDPETRRIPVIFLTGRDDDDTLVKARQLGVDDFLTKPIQVEDLLSAIDKVLKKSRPDADVRPLT
jgi:DNA-binding response OmpR family regulator